MRTFNLDLDDQRTQDLLMDGLEEVLGAAVTLVNAQATGQLSVDKFTILRHACQRMQRTLERLDLNEVD